MQTYDPSKVSVIVGGEVISGFADGTFINAERNEDAFTYVAGSAGKGTRVKNANKSGLITITLQGTSPSNAALNAFADADERDNSGVFSILVRDNSGLDQAKGLNAWVKKKPSMEKAKELSNKEWIIEVEELELKPEGN